MDLFHEILADPLKRYMLIALAALELPAIVFLIWAWLDAKRKIK